MIHLPGYTGILASTQPSKAHLYNARVVADAIMRHKKQWNCLFSLPPNLNMLIEDLAVLQSLDTFILSCLSWFLQVQITDTEHHQPVKWNFRQFLFCPSSNIWLHTTTDPNPLGGDAEEQHSFLSPRTQAWARPPWPIHRPSRGSCSSLHTVGTHLALLGHLRGCFSLWKNPHTSEL